MKERKEEGMKEKRMKVNKEGRKLYAITYFTFTASFCLCRSYVISESSLTT
jgi:hypothetical protein